MFLKKKITPEELRFGIFQAARELSKLSTFQMFFKRPIVKNIFHIHIPEHMLVYNINT